MSEPRTDPLAIASLATSLIAVVADCCSPYLGLALSLLAIGLAITTFVRSRGRGSMPKTRVLAGMGLAIGGLNVLLAVLVLLLILLGGGDFPVDPDANPPPWSPPEPSSVTPTPPEVLPEPPEVLPEPPEDADTARIELADGESVSIAEITERLEIEPGFEVIGVIHRHERWLPVQGAGLVVLRRTVWPDDFEAWSAAVEATDVVRFEGGDPDDSGQVRQWHPERCFGAHQLVRRLPDGSGVGPLVLDVEADTLRPYRLRPVRLSDIPEGYRHGSRAGGQPVFIQAQLRAFSNEDGQPVPLIAQLGGDLFDVSFGDGATLYVFADQSGTLSACAQD